MKTQIIAAKCNMAVNQVNRYARKSAARPVAKASEEVVDKQTANPSTDAS